MFGPFFKTHIERSILISHHDDTIIDDFSLVCASGRLKVVGLDLDVVDVVAFVRAAPELSDDLVDLTHALLSGCEKVCVFNVPSLTTCYSFQDHSTNVYNNWRTTQIQTVP